MTETRYLPLSWMDEICPTPQTDPASFAHRQPDGSWILAPVREECDDEGEWEHLEAPLVPGGIVRLQENRMYPDTDLIVQADGTWTTAARVPDECNCFLLDCDPESLAHTIDDLIKYAGNPFMGEPLEPGRYTLTPYYWSDGTDWRFAPEGETPHFVRVEDAPNG